MADDERVKKKAKQTYTASDAFFETLWDAGVRYCFVNMGSDHPSFLEAMARGIATPDSPEKRFPKMITCPNEMVALSMADGYARYTGKPQCVIVHVDVGTQGLAAAVHNASCGRAPVLIFAGLSPYTLDGELAGTRTEFIHWIQDVPDQKQIVAPYCRYTGEIKRGVNVRQMIRRAISFATSDSPGPVYLYGAREAMEEEIAPQTDAEVAAMKKTDFWTPVGPAALPPGVPGAIAWALLEARLPLVVTGYLGRDPAAVDALRELATLLGRLRVLDSGGSDMSFPADHPAWVGLRYGEHPLITEADVIVVVHCDVPWINSRCKPNEKCRIFHLDLDPLKRMMNVFYIDAEARYQVCARTALEQIRDWFRQNGSEVDRAAEKDKSAGPFPDRDREYADRLAQIDKAAELAPDAPVLTAGYLGRRLKEACPDNTVWIVEAVTQTVAIADQLKAQHPLSWINCGGGGLGWSGGGALGAKLAIMDAGQDKFVCQIVGDGTFLFSVPSSVAWISARYKLPVLTVVLVNGGWHAPRRSLRLVHPHGEASQMLVEDDQAAAVSAGLSHQAQLQAHAHSVRLPLSINDPQPRYGEIATAASGHQIWSLPPDVVVNNPDALHKYLNEAIEVVKGGRSAVLDVCIG